MISVCFGSLGMRLAENVLHKHRYAAVLGRTCRAALNEEKKARVFVQQLIS